ncbi:hypothetical protein JCM8202v2_002475 [Rhodotorula sphaerocarpa]
MPIFGAHRTAPESTFPTSQADRRSMPIMPSSFSNGVPSMSSMSAVRPGHQRTDSSRFRRRLNRWMSAKSQEGLDFGRYPGGTKRTSTSSSGTQATAWTHSRGESSSSILSATSTAASSVPGSPTQRPSSKPQPSPPAYASEHGAVTSRTAERQRSEAAALEAVDEYFRRVRLSATPADQPPPPPPQTFFAFPPRSSSPVELDIQFEDDEDVAPVAHKRTLSDELEIEFIENGHTTFTPLRASSHDQERDSLVIAYEDLSSDEGAESSFDATPVPPSSLFKITEESAETYSPANTARPSLAVPMIEVEGVEEDLVPALEELSDYFVSAMAQPSTPATVRPVSWAPVPIEPLATKRRTAPAPTMPDLSTFAFPPKSAPAAKPTHARTGSSASLPVAGHAMAPHSSLVRPHHIRGQSASFAAAERAKLVAAGRAKPSVVERHLLQERHALYEWI